HRGVAKPERQSGQEAYLGNVDRVEAPVGINTIAHRAAGKDARTDIVADRIAGKGSQRVDAVGDIAVADRAYRKQIIECQGELAWRNEQRGQHDLMDFGTLDGFDDLIGVDAAEHVVKHIASDPDHRDADRNSQLVQDLLLAQQRDRPAYCFQHLDLECDRADGGGRTNLITGGPAPVVARFGPKWNSHIVNKDAFLQHITGIYLASSRRREHAFLLDSIPAEGESRAPSCRCAMKF